MGGPQSNSRRSGIVATNGGPSNATQQHYQTRDSTQLVNDSFQPRSPK